MTRPAAHAPIFRLAALALGAAGLCLPAACAKTPKLDAPPSAAALTGWPDLVPIAPVIDAAKTGAATPDPAAELEARAEALRARAAELDGYSE